jgi:PAS domain S-box-containing protein
LPLVWTAGAIGLALLLAAATAIIRLRSRAERAERALGHRDEHARDFGDYASDWLWEIDAAYRFTVTTSAADWGGIDGKTLIGLRRWEMPGANPADAVWDRYRALLDARQPLRDFEFSYLDATGRRRWASISGRALHAPDGTFVGYRGTAREATAEVEARAKAARTAALLDAVRLIQSSYIGGADPKLACAQMLATLLEVTESAYGFVGEIRHGPGGEPYLKAHAITNIAWNETTRRLYDENAAKGLEFHNLSTLFGAAITSGKPVIANDPKNDPRRGGLAHGHPPLNAFLAVPLYSGQDMVGLMGIANRPGGYDDEIVEFLEPLSGACGAVIGAIQADSQQAGAETELRETIARLNSAERHAHLGSWEADLATGDVIASDEAMDIFGHPLGTKVSRDMFLGALLESDRTRVLAEIESHHTHGASEYDLEYRIQHRLRGVRRIAAKVAVERDAHGVPRRLSGTAQDVTDLRAVEADLRASQERLALALDGTGVSLWDWNLTTGEFKFDRRPLERMGYQPDEVNYSIWGWDSLVHPDDLQAMSAAWERYIRGETPIFQSLYRIRAKNGDSRWILSRGRTVERGIDGLPRRMAGTHLDITDFKQIEIALRRSDDRFRALAESSRAVPWEANIASDRITYVGPQIEAVTGFNAKDWVEQDLWPQRLHPEDRERVLREATEYARAGLDHNLEYRLVAADGRVVWVRDLVSVAKSEDGSTWLYGAMVDVTDEKQREQILRESEARYRQAERVAGLIHWSSVGSSAKNQAKVTYSDTAAAFFGMPPEQLPANHPAYVEQLVHPEDRDELRQAFAELERERSEEYTLEYRIQRKDKSVAVVSEIGRRFYGDDGRALSAFGTIQDITERKHAEDALRRAQLEAEIANRAKSQFLANVSHELRTPLNAIIGFSEIMTGELMGPLGAGIYKEYAGDIHDSGRHLLAIINDILDLSRVEAGQTHLNESTIDVRRLVNSCLTLVRSKADAGGLTMSIEVPVEAPMIVGDERLLKQTMLNLLSNAVKFTPSGGSIQIQARVDTEGMHIAIADSGIGMSESELAQVAKPFVQIENWLVRKYEGTGLGLSIAKAYCELHGGRLDITSAPGDGTTASIHLPASRLLPPEKLRAHAE